MLIEYKNHKIFAFSDTHGLNHRLNIPKDADILICAGDCLKEDNMAYVDDEYLKFLNWYSHQDAKLKIYVPGNHEVFFWMFKGTENKVPKGVDFLITHGPAEGHLDNNTGCQRLRQIVEESKPKHHIFGHVHEEGDKIEATSETTYYNVSMYNQLKYHYPSMKENQELTNGFLNEIEWDIINMYLVDDSEDEEAKCLISLRKRLINDLALSHLKDYIDDIKAFNDSLIDALKEMCDRANQIYTDISKHQEYGDEIKLEARLYLGKKYPALHPIQKGDRQDLWDALLYQQWHQAYSSGITTYYLTKRASNYSFESFTGINDSSSQKLEGIDEGLMKDLNLTNQFLHLYRHTDFALTDFIFVRDFYSEINVEIIK